MKKLSIILLVTFFTFSACNKEEIIQTEEQSTTASSALKMVNISNSQEYIGLTELEQNIVDMLNSSINGLRAMNLNSSKRASDYSSTVNIGVNNISSFNNYALFSKSTKHTADFKSSNGCRVCGIRTGIKCAKAIANYIKENGLSELSVQITVDGDCYDVKY